MQEDRSGPGLERAAKIRRAIRTYHRVIGHTLGIIFVIIGLTGSVLAYWQAVDEVLNREVMLVTPPAVGHVVRPFAEIAAAATAAIPAGGHPSLISMPRHANAAAGLMYVTMNGGEPENYYQIFVDPYTATVTGRRVVYEEGAGVLSGNFIQTMMSLHYTLLLGHENDYIVGFLALLLMPSVFAGLYLWWPRSGVRASAFTMKFGGSQERRLFDLHRIAGATSAPLLLLSIVTGICIIFDAQTRAAVSILSKIQIPASELKSVPVPGATQITAIEAAALAERALPGGTLKAVRFPEGEAGVWIVERPMDGEPNKATSYRTVSLNPAGGDVIAIHDTARFSAGERVLEWLYPLHCGEAFGNAGRGVALALGFVPLLLYLTATLRRRKRRARALVHSSSRN